MNDYFISYKIKYNKETKQEVVNLEKELLKNILADETFLENISTAKRKIDNKPKIKRAVKILLLNLIFSAQIKKSVIISLNDHVLLKNALSPKIYRLVIEWLKSNEYIKVQDGKFNIGNIESARTKIKPSNNFYHFILTNIFKISVVKHGKITKVGKCKGKNAFEVVTVDGEKYIKYIDEKEFNAIKDNRDRFIKIMIDNTNKIIDYEIKEK